MLVLSRRNNESILIGDNVQIKVVDIRGDTVRLGIEAPQDIPVDRQEVYEERLKNLARESAQLAGDEFTINQRQTPPTEENGGRGIQGLH
jgi:carbon storage regulator